MPKPNPGETREDFTARCMPALIGEGKDEDQAAAICMSMYNQEKALGNALKTISSDDAELRVGNYIALYGGRDLEWLRNGHNPDGSMGEFFTEKTVFESPYTQTGVLYVDWEHGEGKSVDGALAPGHHDLLGVIDWKTARRDNHGLWVERVLNRRNEYVRALESLIQAGLIGTSSEAIPEKVVKKSTGEISTWPLMRDTLTVWPAEPRMMSANVLQSVKALSDRMPSLKALLPKESPETGDGGDSAGDETERQVIQLRAKALLLEIE